MSLYVALLPVLEIAKSKNSIPILFTACGMLICRKCDVYNCNLAIINLPGKCFANAR
jgi:hypothetical protein